MQLCLFVLTMMLECCFEIMTAYNSKFTRVGRDFTRDLMWYKLVLTIPSQKSHLFLSHFWQLKWLLGFCTLCFLLLPVLINKMSFK